MKKFASIMKALSLAFVIGLMLSPLTAKADSLKPILNGGGAILNNSHLDLGPYPGAISQLAVPMTAWVAITVGMAVKLSTDTTYQDAVSPTASAGDQNVIGIAINTAAAGQTVYVARSGKVLAKFAANTVIGVFYSPTTSGALTPTSTLSETGFTNLSRTPTILLTLETKTIGSDGLARALIVK